MHPFFLFLSFHISISPTSHAAEHNQGSAVHFRDEQVKTLLVKTSMDPLWDL